MRIIPVLLSMSVLLSASAVNAQENGADARDYDPRDLTGIWGGDVYRRNAGDEPSRGFVFNYGVQEPPPPLTDWGMENLRMDAITHEALGPDPDMTINGVPALTLGGQYPGKNCEPLGQPANLDYSYFGPFEFVYHQSGDRIIQMLEYHREWRTLWLDRDIPENPFPTYMGTSVAHWEDDTLVVDTVGYNGQTQITQSVGHHMSDAFHLVERYTRVRYDRLELELTMYDEKAWGEGAAWTGLKKTFELLPEGELQEFICVPSEYTEFEQALDEGAGE